MSRRQLPNTAISVEIGVLVILTRRQEALARDPPDTELCGTSQLCPSMLELSRARLTENETMPSEEKKRSLQMPTCGGTTVLDHDGSDGTYSHAILRDLWRNTKTLRAVGKMAVGVRGYKKIPSDD